MDSQKRGRRQRPFALFLCSLVTVFVLAGHPLSHAQETLPSIPEVVIAKSVPNGPSSHSAKDVVSDDRYEKMRSSIKQALPYIKRRGDWWIEKNKCMSCHRTSFTAWSHLAAKQVGLKVDQRDVDRWVKFNLGNLLEPFPKKDQKFEGEKTINRNLSGAAQMLFVTSQLPGQDYQAQENEILKFLAKGQRADGRWEPKGQLPGQKRSLVETTQVITHWNSLGLLRLKQKRPKLEQRIDPLIEKAKAFSSGYQDGRSSEWLAVRTLFDIRTNRIPSAKKMLQKLRNKQNEDGGWGWIAGKKSDPLATSQVVYVLSEIRKSHPNWVSQQEVQEPIAWLLKKQKRKGTWNNPGTKTEMKGRIESTATYWATTWAVIAFSNVLEQSGKR